MHWRFVTWLVDNGSFVSQVGLVTFVVFTNLLKQGYCWTRTGERQATRMRKRYLQAVLRQEVGYFDLHVSSTAEIITGVSNDSFVIQDVLSEKMPNFLMNVSTFIGCYIMAFVLLWRLAIVMFPFILLLVIPGVVYGKILIGISRKMKQEYSKAETIAEQAISSARTIYAFVGETKAIAAYSAALQCH
uniref:ABC transmembrane type-1 domain-containing protein n=1 Tax=Salix viminalis TaxID=40686 RepID=A0A6N2KWM0_SALVM